MATHKVIEIVYGAPEGACLVVVKVCKEATVEAVILASGILDIFPAINLATQVVGIFSKKVKLSDIPMHGDRVEIYRPLAMDPKERRRLSLNK